MFGLEHQRIQVLQQWLNSLVHAHLFLDDHISIFVEMTGKDDKQKEQFIPILRLVAGVC